MLVTKVDKVADKGKAALPKRALGPLAASKGRLSIAGGSFASTAPAGMGAARVTVQEKEVSPRYPRSLLMVCTFSMHVILTPECSVCIYLGQSVESGAYAGHFHWGCRGCAAAAKVGCCLALLRSSPGSKRKGTIRYRFLSQGGAPRERE